MNADTNLYGNQKVDLLCMESDSESAVGSAYGFLMIQQDEPEIFESSRYVKNPLNAICDLGSQLNDYIAELKAQNSILVDIQNQLYALEKIQQPADLEDDCNNHIQSIAADRSSPILFSMVPDQAFDSPISDTKVSPNTAITADLSPTKVLNREQTEQDMKVGENPIEIEDEESQISEPKDVDCDMLFQDTSQPQHELASSHKQYSTFFKSKKAAIQSVAGCSVASSTPQQLVLECSYNCGFSELLRKRKGGWKIQEFQSHDIGCPAICQRPMGKIQE